MIVKCGKNCLFVPWSNKLEMVVCEWMFLLLAPCPGNRRFLSLIPFSCKMRTVIDHFSVSGVNASPWISKRLYKTQTVVLWWSSSSRTCYTSIMNEWMNEFCSKSSYKLTETCVCVNHTLLWRSYYLVFGEMETPSKWYLGHSDHLLS